MIYDFALEPELVATWHDSRVAYPFLSQMGPGHCRVACVFPSLAWRKLVVRALEMTFPDTQSVESQRARKNIDILLRHLEETGTRRSGKLTDGEAWLDAATREHNQYPFGGIVVRTSATLASHLVIADRLGEQEFEAWTPPAPPVLRQPRELANALAPILRCARQLRFVDPYFDAEDDSFFEPMKEYLIVAQNRRGVGELSIQVHFTVRPKEVNQASRIQSRRLNTIDVAKSKLDACERRIKPLLKPGVTVRAFVWDESASSTRMHNRYVLTEVGGVFVGTGLDRSISAPNQTDDFTVLSKEQYKEHWAEYRAESTIYRLLADRRFVGGVGP